MNDELDKFDEAQQPQGNQEPILTFQLPVSVTNTIFSALAELPHRIADPIMRNLMEQAQAQIGQGQTPN